VETEEGSSETVPISEVVDNGDGTYEVPLSSVPSGETISNVGINPGADYEQPVKNVSDPTTIDTAETLAQLEEQQKTIEELRKTIEQQSGGGGFGGFNVGGLPTIPGLSLAESAVAVVLGAIGLNVATS
jgi:hypothetical protein